MPFELPPNFTLSKEVGRALSMGAPVVALESTVITHGLPPPQNLALARDMEQELRDQGTTPATIAVVDGGVRIGLSAPELERLANASFDHQSTTGGAIRKISRRDFATAIVRKECGGTTVAGTLFAAHKAGIKVFATGGIGGVHDLDTFDVSHDLPALANSPLIVVCAGAKAILDLPATLEHMETLGIPVIGFQTDFFPEFYSVGENLPVSVRLETPGQVVEFARAHWEIGMQSAVLVCQPPPPAACLPRSRVSKYITQAKEEARQQSIQGQTLTPFLLQRLSELSNGATLQTNLALLLNNGKLAAQIARLWSTGNRRRIV
ncbi:MAG: pseudouridine-5'-phosphate glycosidase [Anaerolineales bacterium]|nr:pseudouridine-5'-phosphate glycosidase [Anaerolineales bacterium]